MDGRAQTPEVQIRRLPTLTKSGGDANLNLEIGGKAVGVKLRIGQLHAKLVAGLPARVLDLL